MARPISLTKQRASLLKCAVVIVDCLKSISLIVESGCRGDTSSKGTQDSDHSKVLVTRQVADANDEVRIKRLMTSRLDYPRP
jgi:hypothetical protein